MEGHPHAVHGGFPTTSSSSQWVDIEKYLDWTGAGADLDARDMSFYKGYAMKSVRKHEEAAKKSLGMTQGLG